MSEDSYNDLMDSIIGANRKANANAVLPTMTGAPPSPDETARTFNNARETDTPYEVAKLQPDIFNREVDDEKLLKDITENPHLQKYFSKGDWAANISRDDTGPLNAFWKTLEPLQRGLTMGKISAQIGNMLPQIMSGEPNETLMNLASEKENLEDQPAPWPEVKKTKDMASRFRPEEQAKEPQEPAPKHGFAYQTAEGIAAFTGQVLGHGGQLLAGTAGGAALGGVTGVGAGPGAAAGFTGTLATTMGQDAAAETMLWAQNYRDDAGQPIPYAVQVMGSVFAGVGVAAFMKGGAEAYTPIMKEVWREIMKNPSAQKVFMKMAFDTGRAGVTGANVNLGMGLVQRYAQDAMANYQDWASGRSVGRPTWGIDASQMVDDWMTGFVFAGMGHSFADMMPGTNRFFDRWAQARAHQNALALDEANKAADQTQTAQRSVEALGEFVGANFGNQEFSFPVTAFDTAAGDKAETFVPKEQLDAARKLQGDVSVKASEYFKMPQEVRAALRNDTRIASDELTVNEATELEQQHAGLEGSPHSFTTDDAAKLARSADRRQIAADMTDRLKNFYSPEEAEDMGHAASLFFGSFAKHYGGGKGAFDLYRENVPRILESELHRANLDASGWADLIGDERDYGPLNILRNDADHLIDTAVNPPDRPVKEGFLHPREGAIKVIDQWVRAVERKKPDAAAVRAVRGAMDRFKAEPTAENGQVLKDELNRLYSHADLALGGRRRLFQTGDKPGVGHNQPPLEWEVPKVEETPWHYSGLNRAIQESKVEKAPATDWLRRDKEGKLSGILAGKPGVTQSELEWQGLVNYLESVERLQGRVPITKQEILTHLGEPFGFTEHWNIEPGEMKQQFEGAVPTYKGTEPTYSGYTLPGGRDKYEWLMSLKVPAAEHLINERAELRKKVDQITEERDELLRTPNSRWHEIMPEHGVTVASRLNQLENDRDTFRSRIRYLDSQISDVNAAHGYTGGHYSGTDNILATSRGSVRDTLGEGEKQTVPTLVDEENQGDWVQDVREKGARTDADNLAIEAAEAEVKRLQDAADEITKEKEEALKPLQEEMNRVYDERAKVQQPFPEDFTKERDRFGDAPKTEEYKAALRKWREDKKPFDNQIDDIQQRMYDVSDPFQERQDRISDAISQQWHSISQLRAKPAQAPFRNTTEMMTTTVNRMLHFAMTRGLKRYAWIEGEEQLERYTGLEFRVDQVSYDPSLQEHQLTLHGGMRSKTFTMTPEEVIKKYPEWGERLINSNRQDTRGRRSLRGGDFRPFYIGGEGHRTFYGNIRPDRPTKGTPIKPKVVDKLVKKMGGTGVKKGTVEVPQMGVDYKGKAPPTTDEIREKADELKNATPNLIERLRGAAAAILSPRQAQFETEDEYVPNRIYELQRLGHTLDDLADLMKNTNLPFEAALRQKFRYNTGEAQKIARLFGLETTDKRTANLFYVDINPKMEANLLKGTQLMNQPGPEGARGRITLGNSERMIELFTGKYDKSTFFHEMSHMWLDMMMEMSKAPDAAPELTRDVKSILDYFGIGHPDELTTEHHEEFAAQFERYLTEGEAPVSAEFRGIFDRIKDWMLDIYKSLTNAGKKVSPELRKIFDKMVASEDERPEVPQADREMVQDLQENGPNRLNRVLTILRTGDTGRAELMLNVVGDDLRELARTQGIGQEALASIESAREAVRKGDVRGAAQAIEQVQFHLDDLADSLHAAVPKEADVAKGLTDELPTQGPLQRVTDAADGLKEAAQNADAAAVGMAHQVARKELHMQALFTDAKAAGMTKPEFKKYSEKVQEAVGEMTKRAIAKARAQIKKRMTEDWKQKEQQVRDESEVTVANKPAFKADDYFSKGVLGGKVVPAEAHVKLDREQVAKEYGDDVAYGVPSYIFGKKGGVHPDEVAELFGYRSGKALLNGLLTLEKRRADSGLSDEEFRAKQIESLVQQKMEARYGILNDNLLAEARGNVQSAAQRAVLSDELRYLARLAGTKLPFEPGDIESITREQFDKQSYSTARDVKRYTRETGRWGRNAELALLRGDFVTAFQAKQNQYTNFVMLKEATDFRKIADKAEKTVKDYQKSPALPRVAQEFTDQIQSMIHDAGEKIPRTYDNLTRALGGKSVMEFAQDQIKEGVQVVPPTYPFMTELEKMNAGEFRDWAATLASLDHHGRLADKLFKMYKEAEFENVKTDIMANLKDLKKKDFNPHSPFHSVLRAGIRGFDSSMIMMERLFDWMDKGKALGPLNTYVMRALLDGVNKKSGLHWTLDTKKEIAKEFKGFKLGFNPKKRVDNDSLLDPRNDMKPLEMNEGTLLTMILNWGTESNIQKLIGGFGWKREEVQNFLDKNARKEHWDAAQKVWNILEKLKPLVAEKTKAVTGVEVDLINDREITTPFGQYTGKYYPLMEDPISRTYRDKQIVEEPLEYQRWLMLPTAQARKARTGKMYPLMLGYDHLPFVLEETIHYLGMIEPFLQVRKILKDPDIRTGIGKAMGPEYVEKINPWLNAIARNGDIYDGKALSFWTNVSRTTRAHMLSFLVGLNDITALLHGGGVGFNSLIETPMKGFGEFFKTFVGRVPAAIAKQTFLSTWGLLTRNEATRAKLFEEVYSKSGELRNRNMNMSEDISQIWFKKMLSGRKGRMDANFMQFNMAGLRMIDQWSSIATWKAVYETAKGQGTAEEDAIFMADKAVRNAHGSTSIVSRAAVQRGGEAWRWLTMFMGFFVNNYNQMRTTARLATDKAKVDSLLGTESRGAKYATVGARTVVLLGMMGLLHHALRGSPSKNESWGDEVFDTLLDQSAGGFPIIRDVTRALTNRRDIDTPMSAMLQSWVNSLKDTRKLVEEEEVSDQWVKHAMGALGTFPGSPLAGKITASEARAAQFLWDVQRGKERPINWTDWMHGLQSGHVNPSRR